MRISRTNFHPAGSNEEEASDHIDHHRLPSPEGHEEGWYRAHSRISDEHGNPVVRQAFGHSITPSEEAAAANTLPPPDGSWESHFYLRPNVRFTRMPDRHAPVPPAAAEAVPPAEEPAVEAAAPAIVEPPVPIEAPPLPVTSVLPPVAPPRHERADDEIDSSIALTVGWRALAQARSALLPVTMPAPIQPAVQTVTAVVAEPTRHPAPTNHLSDFAFWESMAFDLEAEIEEAATRPATVLQPLPPIVPAPVALTGLFRVIEWKQTAASTQEAPVPAVIAPAPEPVPAPAPVAVAIAEPVAEKTVAPIAPAVVIDLPRPVAPAPIRETSGLSLAKPFQVDQRSAAAVAHDGYEYPPRTLLQEPPQSAGYVMAQETLEQNAGLLESVLEDFGVRGEIIHVRPGPVVTLYEFEPAPGVKSSRVIGLADDIARSMSALSARVAVVPGRNVIGIELPNTTRETVYFREMIDSQDFARTGFKLPLCLGKTIGGEPVIAELAKMPHLLVAGTTGSGKSVAINTMILSLLYRFRPEECRLIMVDPKMLELSIYDGIPHLLTPVVTDPKKAVMALKWAVREMEDRYRKMSRLGVRNIDGYNARAASAKEKGETVVCTVQTGFDKGTGEAIHEQQEMQLDPMPYIVVIVDEMADLMMVAGKEIEGAIQRLAQMARAAGIHLIMATQRPSVDVITGTIKANFPTRISFQVTSKIDSRTILGEQGAEQLLGQGDMLHMQGGGRIARVHGPFVSDEEVEKVVLHLKAQGRPEYLDTVTADEGEEEEPEDAASAVFDKTDMASEDGNDLYDKAVKVVFRDKKCSTSYIQRRLAIGYNRAASLVERMEKEGLVGPANHVGKRELLNGNRDATPAESSEAE
ncbi:DNA translocase FtsK [Metarhizobium album]|uniref:DNA translocase FtsK n=1 Tax=Metarhizobium album TaxID=2182425 RepID=A0A2U2DKR8_9HYPH|nr:DNA translocase FtsK [Rhizobium album]PWE53894.1 DNA translocase FtsK [Rhizobium album]